MNDYAPIASRRERIRIALILAAVFVPLALLGHFWLFPAITYYAGYANCFAFAGINGVAIMLYGAFVAMPLSFALIALVFMGPRSLRILRAGQDPLPGETVLRKTKYRYGRRALLFPVLTFIIVLLPLAFSIWGSFQVDRLTANIVPCSEQQKIDLNRGD